MIFLLSHLKFTLVFFPLIFPLDGFIGNRSWRLLRFPTEHIVLSLAWFHMVATWVYCKQMKDFVVSVEAISLWWTVFSVFSQNVSLLQDEISMAHRSIYTNPEKVFPYCSGDEEQAPISDLWWSPHPINAKYHSHLIFVVSRLLFLSYPPE